MGGDVYTLGAASSLRNVNPGYPLVGIPVGVHGPLEQGSCLGAVIFVEIYYGITSRP